MPVAPLNEIFSTYLDGASLDNPGIIDLPSFSKAALNESNYLLVGSKNDLHFYEKELKTDYKNKTISIQNKIYYYLDKLMFVGLQIEPAIRVTTLIKKHNKNIKGNGIIKNIELYLTHDLKDGAIIFNHNTLCRFSQWTSKGAYLATTIESITNTQDELKNISLNQIKKTMNPYSATTHTSSSPLRRTPALHRLTNIIRSINVTKT
ncbi:hypothetical protein [Pseudomonas urmiensis]|uniref:hypothetical protein n=1 Tax=Pseudomonas urmiensis TaxID=2745493 RepID=UPI003CC458B8